MEIHSGSDYEQVDPSQYLQHFYESPPTVEMKVEVKFVLDTLHDIFTTGKIEGQQLLDIGSGPCIHSIISACNKIEDIYLTDYADRNLKFLNSWWTDNSVIQQDNIEYVLEKEGKKQPVEERTTLLKQKVKGINQIDITSLEPLQNQDMPTGYDVVTSSFCLEAACQTREQYSRCVDYIFNLLKDGGHFVLVGNLRRSYIEYRESKIQILNVQRKELQQIFETCGFEIIVWKELLQSSSEDSFTGCSTFLMVAEKTFEN